MYLHVFVLKIIFCGFPDFELSGTNMKLMRILDQTEVMKNMLMHKHYARTLLALLYEDFITLLLAKN